MFDHVADVEGIDGENNKEPWKDRHVWCPLQAVLRILQQTPHEAIGCCIPKPRKLKADSVMIAPEILADAATIKVGSTAGKTCFTIILNEERPINFRKQHTPFFRAANVSPRIKRAMFIQEKPPITIMIVVSQDVKTLKTITNTSQGIDDNTSTSRISKLSIHPPK